MRRRPAGIRRSLNVVLASQALAGLCAVACGSDARIPFDPPLTNGDGGRPSDAGDGDFGDASSATSGTCPERLGTPGLAGCQFLAMNMTSHGVPYQKSAWSGDVPFWGCLMLAVSNVSPDPVRLRLRFEGREEDAAPYAGMATVNGRDVTYAPLPNGVLEPRATALVAASRYVPEHIRPSVGDYKICPFDAFVVDAESSVPLAGKVSSAIELLASAPVLVSQAVQYITDARREAIWAGMEGGTLTAVVPVEAWEASAVDTGVFKPGMPLSFYNPHSAPGTEYEHPTRFVASPARTLIASSIDGTTVDAWRPDGSTAPLHLQRGQFVAYETADAFIGREVVGNHPFGLSTIAPTPYIPWDFPSGPELDYCWNHLPSLPTGLWGSEYVAVRHINRWPDWPERPPWRLIGAADDIALTYEPYHPEGAPDVLRRGELAVFFADEPFVVRSQDTLHPFFFGAHMTGSNYQKQRFGDADPFDNQRGRPIATFVVPPKRWQTAYPFFVLPAVPEHNLVVVRRKGGADVRLDCAGLLTGWESVGADFEFTRVSLTGHYFEPITYPDGTCHAGAHWIESAEPFTGTLWGWSNSDELQVGGNGVAYAVPLHSAQVKGTTPER